MHRERLNEIAAAMRMRQSELRTYKKAQRQTETICLTAHAVDNSLQFCDARDAGGKNKGETFTWDIVNNVAATGGTLTETNTMPETNFTIAQATLTMTEAGQAVPYSGKLEALSKFTVRQPIMQALKNDAKKYFDRAAWAQFDRCMLRYVGTTTATGNFYTNGTTTGTNTSALNTTHLKLIVDYLKERNVAPYVADDYMSIGWPSTFRSIKNTLETLHQYTETGLKMIFNGEIGRYENNRFVEQTNVAKGVTADAGLTGTAWTGGSDWCYFFGEDTVVEGIAVPEEMRAKIPGDYGRSKGVAYYYIGGFGIVHLQAAESRILKWDSLA